MRVIAAVFAVGCTGGKDEPDVSGTTDPATPSTETTTTTTSTTSTTTTTPVTTGNCSVLATVPFDGDDDTYVGTLVRFTLDVADPSATIAVGRDGSAAVPGTSEVAGNDVLWMPNRPLVPQTAYWAALEADCGTMVTHFETSEVGLPLNEDPVGRTYRFGLDGGLWIEPAGVGALIGSLLVDVELLGMPTRLTTRNLDWLGAFGSGSGQDPCEETVPLTGAWDEPFYGTDPVDLRLNDQGVALPLQDVALSGAFSPDATRVQGGRVSAVIDTRPLVDVLTPGGADDAVCVLVGSFGVGCEPCADGGRYCLPLEVMDVDGDLVSGPLVTRTSADIDADPDCY